MSPWQPIETAPKQTVVIAWGGGGMRFMTQDEDGQWRNMLGAPKQPPKFWTMPPAPPDRAAVAAEAATRPIKITIEPTTEMIYLGDADGLDGNCLRQWEGVTEDGNRVIVNVYEIVGWDRPITLEQIQASARAPLLDECDETVPSILGSVV